MIPIQSDLEIPDEEVRFVASRSSGPGGQNVNKVNSRMTLLFDLAASAALSEGQKQRIAERLATRINREGILQVSSQKHRDQGANRAAALDRFAELLREALREEPPRKKTRVSRAAKARRIEEKKKRGRLKSERSDRYKA